MFQGSITALITPFRNGGWTEMLPGLCRLADQEGTDALVPVGTTASRRRSRMTSICAWWSSCIEAAGKRVPVIAGTGSNSTDEAGEPHAPRQGGRRRRGARRAALLQQADAGRQYATSRPSTTPSTSPSIIYNVPPRTAVDMSVETNGALRQAAARHRREDATADLVRPMLTRIAIGPQFCQLSGEDDGRAVPGPGRARLHLRHRERGAAALLPAAQGLAAARSRHRELAQRAPDAAPQGAVRGDQPGPGEIRRQPARPRACRGAPADLRDRRPLEGGRAFRDDLGRAAELTR